jgi:hypothetical protein
VDRVWRTRTTRRGDWALIGGALGISGYLATVTL